MGGDRQPPGIGDFHHRFQLPLGDHRDGVVGMHMAPVAVARDIDLDRVHPVAGGQPRRLHEFVGAVAATLKRKVRGKVR